MIKSNEAQAVIKEAEAGDVHALQRVRDLFGHAEARRAYVRGWLRRRNKEKKDPILCAAQRQRRQDDLELSSEQRAAASKAKRQARNARYYQKWKMKMLKEREATSQENVEI